MADVPGIPPQSEDDRSVSELVFDVAEKSSSLVREEIELAKTEISEKVGKILRGRVAELTDWRRHADDRRSQLMAGAAIAGFALGGLMMLRRRR